MTLRSIGSIPVGRAGTLIQPVESTATTVQLHSIVKYSHIDHVTGWSQCFPSVSRRRSALVLRSEASRIYDRRANARPSGGSMDSFAKEGRMPDKTPAPVVRIAQHLRTASVRSFRFLSRSGLPQSIVVAVTLLVGITSVAVSQPPQNSPAGVSDAIGLPASEGGPAQGGVNAEHLEGVPGPLATSPIAKVAAAGDMIGFSHSDASGTQTITVVHTGKSWMAVYHIDRSGTIRLVSSRPIDADFSLQLNATSPHPDEIRRMGRR
mgnify:CR=1 FL=1